MANPLQTVAATAHTAAAAAHTTAVTTFNDASNANAYNLSFDAFVASYVAPAAFADNLAMLKVDLCWWTPTTAGHTAAATAHTAAAAAHTALA